MLRYIYVLLLFCGVNLLVNAQNQYAAQSVMNEGKWVKIEIEETGIYKLTYADIRKMGFNEPEKVSVYGYGGFPLDEDFSKPYIDDLPQVAVWKGSDYILFYGRGVVKWEYNTSDSQNPRFVHTNNPYSTKAYYFLSDAAAPQEMSSAADKPNSAALLINTFDDYRVHEKDMVSLNNSGRQLFGESLTGTSSSIPVSFSSLTGITDEDGIITMRFVARATGNTGRASLQVDGAEFMTLTIPTTGSSSIDSYTKARAAESTKAWTGAKSENVQMRVSYNTSTHKNVHLDYIRIQMKRELKPYGAYTLFRNVRSINNISRFVIQGANAQTKVFDVTDPSDIKLMEATLNGAELSFTIEAGPLREFALVQTDNAGFGTPVKAGDVVNQNLHELGQTDMVIISQPLLNSEAERLAEVHRERDNLTVQVIDPNVIYNEFSSGTPDATAYRRLMKMFYDRAANENERPKYLLLFGDGVYDNRGISGEVKNTFPATEIHKQLLLTFQSVNSLDIDSYVTDDYFGFLNNTNDYANTPIYRWKLDIGIGRLPIRSQLDARQAVDKIIDYMDNKDPGAWKNSLCFVADDGNSGDNFTVNHMSQANRLGDSVEQNHPEFLVNKVLFDAYKKDFSGIATYPDVRNRIQQLLKNGLLVINYTGHGDTQSWSDERVMTQTDITQARYTRLPLWITATCDFTRFDAMATSAGEQVFLNRTSGGIALFTTTRVVFSNPNFRLNQQLINHLFDKKDGVRYTLGEVLRETKNSSELNSDANKLNFILIGDPALRLAYPDYEMKVTTVNGQPVGEDPFQFQALQEITIEGEVLDPSGNRANDFNGIVYPTVLDSKVTLKTLDNNRIDTALTFTDYPNTLFIGNDRVENGVFRFSFMIPKDISYSNDFGKMNLYASDDNTGIEAQGNFRDFKVGGTNPNPVEDNEGPEIRRYYFNDTTFVSGDKVNTTPLFVADLWDQSGVNISGSSIGHDVMLIIDGNSALSYNLNSYYENIPGKPGEGRVIYSVPALSPGVHSAEFIVWDIHNNSSRESFTFEVVEGLKPVLSEIYATPNPARNQVEFSLLHNRPESFMTVTIMIYDMAGRLRWQHEEQGSSELFKDYIVSWDLVGSNGMRLSPGVYVYRAAIKTDRSKEATDGNKLIILAQ